MFENFKKLNTGRTKVKLIATMLALILTFSNFTLLSSYIVRATYEAETEISKQNNKTNSDNVKFEAYFDAVNRDLKECSVDINSENVKLYISVNVQNGGYLRDAKVKFEDANFKIKGNEQIAEFNLGTIQADKEFTVEIPLLAISNETCNLGLLNMASSIKLTGEYIDNKGNVTDIEAVKKVKIAWETKNISEEDLVLSQEVITNKIYEINGKAKRVIQVLVKSSIKDSIVPVKQTNIEMSIPKIEALPDEVKVASYGTKATNGRTSLEFADLETSSWKYDKETGKINIEILNPISEEGNISWLKNVQDEIIVTYIYDEDVAVTPFISNAKMAVETYGAEGSHILEKVNDLQLEEIQEMGDIILITNNVSSPIYKGNLYVNGEQEYAQVYNIYVSYKDLVNKIQIQNVDDQIVEGVASTYYRETRINKKQAINVLGEEGTINIYNAEGNELLQVISLADETESDYIIVEYDKGIDKIVIEMVGAQKEGNIEIINKKVIESSKEEGAKISKLVSNVKLLLLNENNIKISEIEKSANVEFLEPKTNYSISLDKTSLSTGIENELKITAELKTENASHKLFENPEIRIELPAEVKDAEIENITPVLYSKELKLKSYEIVTNTIGNKEVVIKIEGAQTKYEQNNAYVAIDLNVKTNSFMASKNAFIKAVCINGEEKVEEARNITLVSKKGFITKNTLLEEETVEEINTNLIQKIITKNTDFAISSKMINNFGENLSNINILGNLEDGMVLTEKVTTNINGSVVYYSTEKGAEINSKSWTLEANDLSKVKAFKIEIPGEVKQADILEIGYKLRVSVEDLTENKILTNNLNVNYLINEQAKQEKIEYVVGALVKEEIPGMMSVEGATNEGQTAENQVEIKVKPKAMTETLYQGQIVTYEIIVKNNGKEDLENTKIIYTVPEGAVLTELTYSQGANIEYTDKEKVESRTITLEGKLKPGQERVAEVTLRIKPDVEQIVNNIEVKTEEDETVGKLETNPVKVISGDLTVRMSRELNYVSIFSEGSSLVSIISVKNNTQTIMNNLEVKSKLPEGTIWLENSEYSKNWKYDEETKEISYLIDTIAAGETKDIWFEVKINKTNNKTYEYVIDNMALVKTDNKAEYASNVYKTQVTKEYWKISNTALHEDILKEGDAVKYIINVTNIGKRAGRFNLIDEIPEQIHIKKVSCYSESIGEDYKKEYYPENNIVEVSYSAEIGETVIIEIEGTVKELEDGITNRKITNIAKIDLGDNEYIESNLVINTIIKNNTGDDTEKPGDDTEKPGDNTEKPGDNTEKNTYSISGTIWLDKNKDGIRDSNEEVIQSQKIVLLDEKGKVIEETISSLTGTYKFTNLSNGKYLVAVAYDKDKYTVTKYQVEEAKADENSDVIAKEISLNGKNTLVGITDTLTINNKDILNIDMGLIENAVFDLSLSKYISKVVVTTSKEAKTYEYEKSTNLAKVEIGAKEISGASMLVEYEIEVVNEGDVEGYVTDIIDYLPKELTFSSEMNAQWYKGTDNNLHYMPLEPKAIKPGESQKVKLVLTRNLKNNSTGTIKNTAEIGASTNLEGLPELDSIAGNNNPNEDDISVAELIVSIKTGSPAIYIGIVIASMLVLGIGIYIINKKVLRVKF